MNNKIQCFVFSWRGQYDNAKKLEKQLKEYVNVVVINSDDENIEEDWINIGNECYFSEQFKTALNHFDSEKYDFFFHIQADAVYDDWENILSSAEQSFIKYNWGVFAPNVDDTFYISDRTDAFELEEKYRVVANTDNTCWIIHKDIINDLLNNIYLMDSNKLGWGWDLLLCAFSHLKRKYVIRDYSHTIFHPKSSGYKKEEAEDEMIAMFEKTKGDLRTYLYYMKTNPSFFGKIYQKNDANLFTYNTEIS